MFQLSGSLGTYLAKQSHCVRSAHHVSTALVLSFLMAGLSGTEFLFGQSAIRSTVEEIHDANGFPFVVPASSPLEPVHRIAVAIVDRDTVKRTIGLAEFGDRLGFWIVRAPHAKFELAGALQGGVSSRFDLGQPRLDLLEIHYRAGFLLRARVGAVAARVELYHVSSHLGDELMARHDLDPISTSREGLEILLQVSPSPGIRFYGGPGFLLKSSSDFSTPSLRAGGDWQSPGNSLIPGYATVDVFSWSELNWRPQVAAEVGVTLGKHARIGLMLGLGPSRAEQFFRDNETIFGLSASYVR